MLHVKSFVKKTKGGQVLRVVREHYVRDDISSGTPLDPLCPPESVKLGADAPHYIVADTNIVLHQPDFLEHPSTTDVIILSTVYQEVQARNSGIFLRLREMLRRDSKRFFFFSNEHHQETYVVQGPGESANDRNDRAIRTAVAWFTQRACGMPVLLLSEDAANIAKACEAGLLGMSLAEFVEKRAIDKSVVDVIAWVAGSGTQDDGAKQPRQKRSKVYKDHLPFSALQNGVKTGKLMQGTLRVNRYNPFEGWVSQHGAGQNVLVKGKASMNRAFDADVVVVEMLPSDEWEAPSSRLPVRSAEQSEEAASEVVQHADAAEIAPEIDDSAPNMSGRGPTGVVVGIVQRSWRARGYAGSLKEPEGGRIPPPGRTASLLFVPLERRIPYIRVQTRQSGQLMDKRIVVVVDEWPVDSQYPIGHYVRTLGVIGNQEAEKEVLLLEYDINTAPFTAAVHACVPPLPWAVAEADIAAPYRRDLRHICVCSVDPPGCKDIDDALHARALPNGNWELGVHIADVTHFVLPGSAMDEEAARRSTTVYMVDARIDMLPKPLTEDICSLRADGDRLSFSVIWEVTRDVVPVRVEFTKSIIRSRAALTYEQAQVRINDSSLTDEVTTSLRLLMDVSKVLRQRRYRAGALNLASPEVKFKLDSESNSPLDVGMYQLRETNAMVEEMMLMANCTVAEFIHRAFPACAVLRKHEPPTPEMFEPLIQACQACGFGIKTGSSKEVAASLDQAVRREDPYFNKLVRIMATRCMTQAKYFASGDSAPSEFLHYGLAAPIYTHFTSPIRRYADVLVHRCLAAALGLTPLPEGLKDRTHMCEIVDNMNLRHYNAQQAGRSSSTLYTLFFFRDKETFADARVLRVQANGLIVFVPKFGIEGAVYFEDGDEDNKKAALKCTGTEISLSDGQVFKIFDKCAVKIYVQKGWNHRENLKVELVDRSLVPIEELAG